MNAFSESDGALPKMARVRGGPAGVAARRPAVESAGRGFTCMSCNSALALWPRWRERNAATSGEGPSTVLIISPLANCWVTSVSGRPPCWDFRTLICTTGTPSTRGSHSSPSFCALAQDTVRHIPSSTGSPAVPVPPSEASSEVAGRGGTAEAMETVAHGTPGGKVVGRAVEDIKLPEGARIITLVRGAQVIMAHHDTVVETGDHVILFLADRRHVEQVERLFQS